MKIALMSPRLDCSFKQGDVPATEGPPNHPLRLHWMKFTEILAQYHAGMGDTVVIHKLPLWQMTLEYVKETAQQYDAVYMPHKMKMNFDAGDNVFYYMQTVLPWLFTIDHQGWGAALSWSPLTPKPVIDETLWKYLQGYKNKNQSKFEQPEQIPINEKDFALFICQIPHDETIKYFSNYSVLKCLEAVCDATKLMGKRLIVKGHPINPYSMEHLIAECKKHNHVRYCDNVSIHELMSKASHVITVNSGSMLEAMLHEKPIYAFGGADYGAVVNRFPTGTVDYRVKDKLEAPFDRDLMVKTYKYFVTDFVDHCYNYNDPDSFKKVIPLVKDHLINRNNPKVHPQSQ